MAGIYVHIPFCKSKCGYCAFNSRSLSDLSKLDVYFDALEKEIGYRQDFFDNQLIETIYFGGGTPTIASPEQIQRILKALSSNFPAVAPDCEITIEANPDTIDEEKLRSLIDIGVNRISIGAQSFDPSALEFLERRHDAEKAEQAFIAAQQAGFQNIGLDLIAGLPKPFDKIYKADLARAIDLAPQHLSVYLLTVENPSRLFFQVRTGEVKPLVDDAQAEIFLDYHEILTSAGYEHYEVSNFSKPGFASRHNSSYWESVAYLGLGAGASSYQKGEGRPIRWNNEPNPEGYVQQVFAGRNPLTFSESISEIMEVKERLMLELRTSKGVDLESYGKYAAALQPKLDAYAKQGFLEKRETRYCPTPKGFLTADGMAADLWDVL